MPDTTNNRVLIWTDVLAAGGAPGDAQIVLGQQNKDACQVNDHDGDRIGDGSPNAQTMSVPRGVWSDGSRLVVADTHNHRVLIWTSMPSGDGEAADIVIGQPDFLSEYQNGPAGEPSAMTLKRPYSVDVSSEGELAVADSGNNRILVWRTFPDRNGQAADYVLGQADFEANGANGTGEDGTGPGANTLDEPSGVRFHGKNLIVTDKGNNRVLIWRRAN